MVPYMSLREKGKACQSNTHGVHQVKRGHKCMCGSVCRKVEELIRPAPISRATYRTCLRPRSDSRDLARTYGWTAVPNQGIREVADYFCLTDDLFGLLAGEVGVVKSLSGLVPNALAILASTEIVKFRCWRSTWLMYVRSISA